MKNEILQIIESDEKYREQMRNSAVFNTAMSALIRADQELTARDYIELISSVCRSYDEQKDILTRALRRT